MTADGEQGDHNGTDGVPVDPGTSNSAIETEDGYAGGRNVEERAGGGDRAENMLLRRLCHGFDGFLCV